MKCILADCCGWMDERRQAMLTDAALLVLRVGFGCAMLFGHGLPKLLSYGETAASFPDPIGLGGPLSMALVIFAEFFCSIAVVLGLLTRLALLPLIFNMGVAFFVIHAGAAFKVKELALVYLLVYVALWLHGPGRFSIDRLLLKCLRAKCTVPTSKG